MLAKILVLILLPITVFGAAPKRELRAAWIATVFNIDWPSSSGLPEHIQKKEMLSILDTLQNLKFNAAILQVKPTADAFYQSKLSPWSRFLTGQQGSDPGYDPLAFFIEEAQKRNIETHIWINPFRVLNGESFNSLSQNHIARKQNSWIINYNNRYYFDPGNPQVQSYILKEIIDLIKRYDIDAIHFDDYFYPYKIYNKGKVILFDDTISWKKYGKKKFTNREDWRRNNINEFIKQVSQEIKKHKPYVKFGISPFGVWRNRSEDPKGSNTKAGQTNYDDLFADVLTWINNGWIDYVMPQIYWHFDTKGVPYDILVDWWKKQIKNNINLYIGLGVYKLGEQNWPASHITKQVDYARKKNIPGFSAYSINWIKKNTQNITNEIISNIQPTDALVPINKKMINITPLYPKEFTSITNNNDIILKWKNNDPENTRYFILYKFEKDNNSFNTSDANNIIGKISASTPLEFEISNFDSKYTYGITSVSRLHYESELILLEESEKRDSLEQLNELISKS